MHSGNWKTFGRRFWDASHRRGRCLLAGGHGAAACRDGKIDLLLIRMESLDLDLGEVRRSAASTFCKLADSCVNCECKERCERDLAYASAEMVTPDWENYCPNATTLKAMSALPWFGKPLS